MCRLFFNLKCFSLCLTLFVHLGHCILSDVTGLNTVCADCLDLKYSLMIELSYKVFSERLHRSYDQSPVCLREMFDYLHTTYM